MDPSYILIVLAFAGFAAGFVDAVAGGGGLIALPALMTTGLPPSVVIGTLKLQSLFGTSASAYGYFGRNTLKTISDNKLAFCFTAAGAVGGTLLLNYISPDLLMVLVPGLLIAVSIFVVFYKPPEPSKQVELQPVKPFTQATLGTLWGGYDGFFGPGTGIFWTLSLVKWGKQSLLDATALTKIMNMCSNVVSVIVFTTLGAIHVEYAIIMGVGQMIGGYIGARMGQRFKAALIRPMVIAFSLMISIKLIWDQI